MLLNGGRSKGRSNGTFRDGNGSNKYAETDGLFEGVPCVSQRLACDPNCTNGKIQVGGSGSDPGVSIFLTEWGS